MQRNAKVILIEIRKKNIGTRNQMSQRIAYLWANPTHFNCVP